MWAFKTRHSSLIQESVKWYNPSNRGGLSGRWGMHVTKGHTANSAILALKATGPASADVRLEKPRVSWQEGPREGVTQAPNHEPGLTHYPLWKASLGAEPRVLSPGPQAILLLVLSYTERSSHVGKPCPKMQMQILYQYVFCKYLIATISSFSAKCETMCFNGDTLAFYLLLWVPQVRILS